jgi:hypothetical protein
MRGRIVPTAGGSFPSAGLLIDTPYNFDLKFRREAAAMAEPMPARTATAGRRLDIPLINGLRQRIVLLRITMSGEARTSLEYGL